MAPHPRVVTLALLVMAVACGPPGAGSSATPGGGGQAGDPARTQDAPRPAATPVHGYKVVKRHPHDPDAAAEGRLRGYTQGLVIVDGELFESTGKYGESTVRQVDLETGKIERTRAVDRRYFAEGIAAYKGLLVMLTWREGKALVYDRQRLKEQYTYSYRGEGWGLTFDGQHFWMSDGTSELRVLDPDGFKELRRIPVTDGTRRIAKLNELEWIEGELWANVWQTDRIARIDPTTGKVKAWLDCTGILGDHKVEEPLDEVLNGIAWDAEKRKLYLTGKRWPWLYEVQVVDRTTGEPVPIGAEPR